MQPATMSTDLYSILGVDICSSTEEITRAYRRLALQFHPDKNKGDSEESTAAFQNIQDAYETLRDPTRRLMYDEARTSPHQGAVPTMKCETQADDNVNKSGGLALGTCLLATLAAFTCGIAATCGAVLCGAGHLLLQYADTREQQRRYRLTAGALMCFGFLFLWGSAAAWVCGMYALTVAGLVTLSLESDVPDFLPYMLFMGFLLLYLLAPTRQSSPHVNVYMVGETIMLDENTEGQSETLLPECVALFTWGTLAIKWLLSSQAIKASRPVHTAPQDV